jgi:hypothetical protein
MGLSPMKTSQLRPAADFADAQMILTITTYPAEGPRLVFALGF